MRCTASTLWPGAASMASVGVRINIPDWKRRYNIPCTSAPVQSSIMDREKINNCNRVCLDEMCRVLRRWLQQSANKRTTAPYAIAELIIPNICISTCWTLGSAKRNIGGQTSGKSIGCYTSEGRIQALSIDNSFFYLSLMFAVWCICGDNCNLNLAIIFKEAVLCSAFQDQNQEIKTAAWHNLVLCHVLIPWRRQCRIAEISSRGSIIFCSSSRLFSGT